MKYNLSYTAIKWIFSEFHAGNCSKEELIKSIRAWQESGAQR